MITGVVIRTVRLATQKQKDLLDKFGVRFSKNITVKEASELISKEIEERKSRSRKPRGTGSLGPFGNGYVHFTHGVMDYCDDGNGNEWNLWDELDASYDGWND